MNRLFGALVHGSLHNRLFVLVAAAFGSRRFLRDAALALALTLATWFLFVELLGVNIGAGVLEGLVLRALGREPAA